MISYKLTSSRNVMPENVFFSLLSGLAQGYHTNWHDTRLAVVRLTLKVDKDRTWLILATEEDKYGSCWKITTERITAADTDSVCMFFFISKGKWQQMIRRERVKARAAVQQKQNNKTNPRKEQSEQKRRIIIKMTRTEKEEISEEEKKKTHTLGLCLDCETQNSKLK